MQFRQMAAWVHANGIAYPFHVIPSAVFEDNFITRSAAVIIGHGNIILSMSELPLTPENEKEILDVICSPGDTN